MKNKILMGLVLIGLTSGCATNRGFIDVRVPYARCAKSGAMVKITEVNDLRKFELTPSVPSIPSLKDGQINNSSITSRAIARKRNGYGRALGDILLPAGRTVEDLVREITAKALMEQGYVVLKEGVAGYQEAVPVEVDIHQFWAWVNPGFWSIRLDFEAIVAVNNGEIFISPDKKIRGYVGVKTQAAGTKAWTKTFERGIAELGEQIKKNVKRP